MLEAMQCGAQCHGGQWVKTPSIVLFTRGQVVRDTHWTPIMLSTTSSSEISPAVASLGALALGTVSFWGYFHRFETHMYAFTYFYTFLAAYVGLAIGLCKAYSYSIPASAATSTSVALAFLVGAYGNCLIYRYYKTKV